MNKIDKYLGESKDQKVWEFDNEKDADAFAKKNKGRLALNKKYFSTGSWTWVITKK